MKVTRRTSTRTKIATMKIETKIQVSWIRSALGDSGATGAHPPLPAIAAGTAVSARTPRHAVRRTLRSQRNEDRGRLAALGHRDAASSVAPISPIWALPASLPRDAQRTQPAYVHPVGSS